MAQTLPDIVTDTELQAIVTAEHTIHTLHVVDPRPRKVDQVWSRERELGRGICTVWLEKCIAGRDRVGKYRAVKEIQHDAPDFSASEVARELEAIGRLSQRTYRHRFVRSFGWYKVDKSVFIAMEYLPLGDLSHYLSKPIPENEALDITQQLLEGLQFMHNLGFAHRDLKPKNILIQSASPDWYVKIADFGISKRVRDSSRQTGGIGTPSYMAPEALKYKISESHAYAVDMWAIGVVAWQIITTELLFPNVSDIISYADSSDHVVPKCSIASAEFNDFVEKCLLVSASERLTLNEALDHSWLSLRVETVSELVHDTTASTDMDVLSGSEDRDCTSATGASWTTRPEDKTDYYPQEPVVESNNDEHSLVERRQQEEPTQNEPVQDEPTPDQPSQVQPAGEQEPSEPSVTLGLLEIGKPSIPLPPGTSLHQAAKSGDAVAIKSLLLDGIAVDIKNEFQQTPLHYAVVYGQLETVRDLIRKNALVGVEDNWGLTPLHMAAHQGHTMIIQLLVGSKAQIEAKDEGKRRPLHYAASNGHTRAMEILLFVGAEVDVKTRRGNTALHMAADNGHVGTVRALIETRKSLIDVKNWGGALPSTFAVQSGHTDIIKVLLGAGASSERINALLRDAVYANQFEPTKLLLERGADPDQAVNVVQGGMKDRKTLLCAAVFDGHIPVVKLLLDAKADPNLKIYNPEGNDLTALHQAVYCGHAEVVKFLLDSGANPYLPNEYNLPIHAAASSGKLECIKYLLAAGVPVDQRGEYNWTPLHYAANWGHVDVIELLLKTEASPSAKSNRRSTPLDLAKSRGHEKAAEILVEAMAAEEAKGILPVPNLPPKKGV